MPELPDVEVFRRYLDSTSLHKTVRDVDVRDAGVLRSISGRGLEKSLKGRSLESTRRRGKHLLARLDEDGWLTIHFGMTGYLEYFKSVKGERPHDRVVMRFDNGYHLAFVCQRKLGRIGLVKHPGRFFASHALGPDALDLDMDTFRDMLGGRRGAVKPALMDQSFIAGIGNIYADEILYHAGIDPRARASSLGHKSVDALFGKMKRVLNMAIDRKADPERLPRTWLLPHREEGASCPKCGGTVKRIRLSNRSAYLCPRCQAKPGS